MSKAEEVNCTKEKEEVTCRPSKEGWYIDLADGDHEVIAGPYPTLIETRAAVADLGMVVRDVLPLTLAAVKEGSLFKCEQEWFYLIKAKRTSAEVRGIGCDLKDLPLSSPVQLSVLSTT